MSDISRVSALEQKISDLEARIRTVPGSAQRPGGIGDLAAFSTGSCTNECTAACTIGCTQGCTGSCVAQQRLDEQVSQPGVQASQPAAEPPAALAGAQLFNRLAKR